MANSTSLDRLKKLIAFHENAAAAVRTTIALLRGEMTPSHTRVNGDTNGRGSMLTAALALDAARRAKKPGPKKGQAKRDRAHLRKSGGYVDRMVAARRKTVKELAKFDATEPRGAAEVLGKARARLVGTYMNGGYLKRKGDGFIRTEKPFVIDPSAAAE